MMARISACSSPGTDWDSSLWSTSTTRLRRGVIRWMRLRVPTTFMSSSTTGNTRWRLSRAIFNTSSTKSDSLAGHRSVVRQTRLTGMDWKIMRAAR